MNSSIDSFLDRFPSLSIAVIGDVMLDRFTMGKVDRISPEAPVPVVHVESENSRLGGAANVAANVAALGAPVSLFGVVGAGPAAAQMSEALRAGKIASDCLLECPERLTTVKTRILAGSQQVVRIDRETKEPLSSASRKRFLESFASKGPFDAVIVSDYGKGVVGEELMDILRQWHRQGSTVVVDPKQGNFELYRELSCITPNQKEAAAACHATIASDEEAGKVGWDLRERLQTDMLLLTRGEHGMMLFEKGGKLSDLSTEARHVYDVTGAGDTVIACFTSLLAVGAAPVEAASWANRAAGMAVAELGTAVITAQRLKEMATSLAGDQR